MKLFPILSLVLLACKPTAPADPGTGGSGGASASASGGGGGAAPADPFAGCIEWRPVPLSCGRPSDCWRDDCSVPDCNAVGACVYTPKPHSSGADVCRPDRPGPWECREGHCCPVALPVGQR